MEQESDKPVVCVDWDDETPETYNGLIVMLPNEKSQLIRKGNFKLDFQYLLDEYGGECLCSPSVNIMLKHVKWTNTV